MTQTRGKRQRSIEEKEAEIRWKLNSWIWIFLILNSIQTFYIKFSFLFVSIAEKVSHVQSNWKAHSIMNASYSIFRM